MNRRDFLKKLSKAVGVAGVAGVASDGGAEAIPETRVASQWTTPPAPPTEMKKFVRTRRGFTGMTLVNDNDWRGWYEWKDGDA